MNINDSPRRRVVLVTGLSGAGKSLVLKTLEDLEYEAIDNPPLSVLHTIVMQGAKPLAICLDARREDFSAIELLQCVKQLRANPALYFSLLYLESETEILQRRFTETRRKHPLAGNSGVVDAIMRERALLSSIRDTANLVLDTTDLSVADNKRIITDQYHLGMPTLTIMVTSFSFRRGLPREADLVFDVRFLRNPFYVDALKHKDGRDEAVGDYIQNDPDFAKFFLDLTGLMKSMLPRYLDEGKSYLTIAVGCTGGRHRSVYTAQKLSGFLENLGYKVSLRHRDVDI